jgi:hypothetical protein
MYVENEDILQKKLQLISEIRSLSADCLPSLIKASIQRGLG